MQLINYANKVDNMKTYKINEIKSKRILGRNVKNAGKSDKPLALFWGASALEINVKAKQVWLKVSSCYDQFEPWIAVFVNGSQTGRFMVPSGETFWICVAANMNPEKENLITVMKDTQPMSGEEHHSLFIHEVGLDENGSFCDVVPRNLSIEFIGDSITSGEGLAGNPEEGDWITQWFCASKTYAVQAAMALGTDWNVMSQCGWGLCWGWNGDTNTKLPPHYENVCSVMWGDYQKSIGAHDKYDFGKGSDYVVLNLGTNDNGAFFQPPWKDENGVEHVLHHEADEKASPEEGKIISDAAKAFLISIRKNNPAAKIIWTWGMMKLTAVPFYIQQGIDEYKSETGDNNVYTLLLDPMEENEKLPEDKGSRGHPGPKTHTLAKNKIVDFIKSIQ